MPRIARIVGVGLPHHITQRGNYQQNIFRDDSDRERYLSWLQEYSSQYGLSILAYCLMNNHVHFVALPQQENSLARTFNTVHMRYSQYFNQKMKARGHLWQGRYYSCVLGEEHLMAAARYIERNPVRAKLVKQPWDWKWSSAAAHIGKEKPAISLNDMLRVVDMTTDGWRRYLADEDSAGDINTIRQNTLTGRPCGSRMFIQKLERWFGRRLQALPRGRPRKSGK